MPANTPETPLSDAQRYYLGAMMIFWRLTGKPPTHREIIDQCGHTSTNNSVCHVYYLRSKGCMRPREAPQTVQMLLPTGFLPARPDGSRKSGVSLAALSPVEGQNLIERLLANAPNLPAMTESKQ